MQMKVTEKMLCLPQSASDPPNSSRRHRGSLLGSTWLRGYTGHQSGHNLQTHLTSVAKCSIQLASVQCLDVL